MTDEETLELVRQLREARRIIEENKRLKMTDARVLALRIEMEGLELLRDKLELGE